MDQFASETNLFIKSNSSYRTAIGGVISLIQIFVSLIIALIFVIDYLNKDEFTIKVYSEEILDNVQNYYLDLIVSYPKSLLESTRWLSYDLMEFSINPFTECTTEEYKNFYQEKPRNQSMVYFCKESRSPNKAYDFWYQLARCSGLNQSIYWQINDTTCKRDPTPEEENSLSGELMIKYKFFNETEVKNKLNEVQIVSDHVDLQLYYWDYWRSDFRKSNVDVNNFFSKYNTYHWTSFESLNRFPGYNDYLYMFEIHHFNYLTKSIQKSKIPNLISRIYGVLEIINLISYLLTNFCSEFYYHKYVLNNLFDENDKHNLYDKLFSKEELKNYQSKKLYI